MDKRARGSLDKTIKFVQDEWSESSAEKVIKKLNNFLKVVRDNPEMGKVAVEEKGIRSFVISRHNTILYRIKKDTIIILKFLDNRQKNTLS